MRYKCLFHPVLGLLAIGLIIVVSLSLNVGVSLAQSGSQAINTWHFSGIGSQWLGPMDVAEGALDFHIRHKTDCQACYFAIGVSQDNNLDGVYCDDGDGWCVNVFSSGYGDIQNLDTTATYDTFYYGGSVKLFIDAPSSGVWEIDVEQRPFPCHSIGGDIGMWLEGA